MAKSKPYVPGQLGMFKPETSWVVPTELPDLRGRPMVAIDSETKDEGLIYGLGTGWARGPAGYIAGVSWAAEGSAGYAPIRHPDTECFPRENVMRWLDDLFKSGTKILFHNGPYDVGWFGSYGVAPPPNMEDTLVGSVMLDEGASGGFSLDTCCARQGIEGKDTAMLRQAVEAYGGNPKKPAADLWRVPARYAGPYAEQDGVATLGLWKQIEGQLRAQDVVDAYRTEIDLIPMVVAMRRRGIRVDLDRAVVTKAKFLRQRDAALAEITRMLARRRAVTIEDVRSPATLGAMMQAEGVKSPARTATGRDSYSVDWMATHPHWLPRAVCLATKFHDAAEKFVQGFIMDYAVRGRLHAEINQFLTDDGGTRSHRFSYSDPPLQQMNSPDKDPRADDPDLPVGNRKGDILEDLATGTPIRRLFLPEPGTYWAAPDFSSQEPRLTVHFASVCKCQGAQAIVDEYVRNPRTDYHAVVAKMVGKPRPQAKILNLGMTYGKGKKSLAEELGLPLAEAELILKDYHERLPYIKQLEDICKRRTSDRGYIRLIDGARMHYNSWEGGWIEFEDKLAAQRAGKNLAPCSRKEAEERQRDPDHPWSKTRLRRADTRKALNNLVQGSAARQTKIAMVQMWREGILPLIQMHDEIGFPAESEEQVERVSNIMINAVKLVVPVVVDAEVGPTWGEAKLSWKDCVAKYGEPRLAA